MLSTFLFPGITSAAAGGKLPPGIAGRLDKDGWSDVLLLLDNSDAKALKAQTRQSRLSRPGVGATLREKARLYTQKKGAVLSKLAASDFVLKKDYEFFPILFLRLNRHAVDALLEMPEVRGFSEDIRVEPFLSESLPLINAPAANSAGATGAGTFVAVLDTGVDYGLAAFGSCTAPGDPSPCKIAFEECFATGGCQTNNDHGTNVSGIVVGVAPDTLILSLDVFGTGGGATYNDIISALNWVMDPGQGGAYNIVAVNMSFGSPTGYTAPCPLDALADAISTMKDEGIATAVASGNYGFTTALTAPACGPDAVSVGAVYDSDVGGWEWCLDALCDSTCTDATTAADQVTCFSDSASFLTMLAPGSIIDAAGISMSGTSQAAPHVAGAVAALQSFSGPLTVDNVVSRLTNTGVPVLDTRNSLTKPRLNLYASVFPGPLIGFSPVSLSFNEIGNGAVSPSQVLNVANYGTGTLNWTAGESLSWLAVNPSAGVNSAPVTVSITSSALTPGTYSGNITIASPDAPNTPQAVPVTLTVFDPVYADGFESGDMAALPWSTGGSGSWFIEDATKYSGTYAAQSPAMGNNATSYLEVTLNICSSGYVYFWLKTSTEPQWDNLKFRIDGVNEGPFGGWSGETDWTQVRSENLVSPGLHTFRWEYSKDRDTAGGSDAVWLDDIVFPSFNLPVKVLSEYYTDLQSAYDAASDSSVIMAQSYPFSEDVDLNRNISVTLKGGYDCQYSDNTSFTTISGSLTVRAGTVTVEHIEIK